MTDIESCAGFACDHVHSSGLGFDSSDRGYEIRVALGGALDGDDPLRGSGESIVAEAHGRGTSVIGVAPKQKFHARLAGDRVDRCQRAPQRFEHGALLDMKFEVCESV